MIRKLARFLAMVGDVNRGEFELFLSFFEKGGHIVPRIFVERG